MRSALRGYSHVRAVSGVSRGTNSSALARLVLRDKASLWPFPQTGIRQSSAECLIAARSALGVSVSLSADGNTAIVGGFADDTLKGAAWVFTRAFSSVRSPGEGAPLQFDLAQNYPNPFNPSTTIKFELPKASQVNLTVFDMLGREVSALVSERRNAGVHEVKFDGSNLASGVYFYRLQAGNLVATKRLVLLR